MGHTYTGLITHVIFSTKDRIPYIVQDHRERVFAYIGGILRGIDCEVLSINGVADHVHMLFKIPATLSLAEAMRIAKTNSSKWIHETGILKRTFAWQRGYAGFSVSHSSIERVMRYVESQEVHHRRLTFQEELLAFLRQHGIQYEEKYLWD
jgi:REP element-mobilizing transposase RayT